MKSGARDCEPVHKTFDTHMHENVVLCMSKNNFSNARQCKYIRVVHEDNRVGSAEGISSIKTVVFASSR